MSYWVQAGASEEALPKIEEALRGDVPEGSVEVVARILRRVLRIELESEAPIYCKQNLFPFLRLRLRYLFRSSPTQKERRLLEACRRIGIQCPEPIAESTRRGLLGPKLAVLITRALPTGRAPTPREHLRAVQELAEKGLYHPDLHGDNLRILPDGQLATLDLQSCRLRSRPVGGRSRQRMMAKAALALVDQHGPLEVESLLRAEQGADSARSLLTQIERLSQKRLESRQRHLLRSSSRVQASRPALGRKRLILRGVCMPMGFSEPVESPFPRLGTCLLARAPEGAWRIQCKRGLRQIWLASLLRGSGPESEATSVGDEDRKPEVFAWEGPSMLPFGIPFGPELLYISGCKTESQLESLIFPLLSTPT